MSYVSLQKSQLLDSIESHVLYADLCCVVIGNEGLGKTFFVEQLTQRLEGKAYLSQIQALPEMTLQQLEKSICLQLGLGWQETEAKLHTRIKEKLDQRGLLVVDDAHLLSLACLEYLMALVHEQFTQKATTLYIVLTGLSDLAEKLNQTDSLSNNPNICAVFELQAIEANETKQLIAYFQAIDEVTVETLYDEQKLHYFWELSQGRPAELKYQLERWLSQTSVKAKVTEDENRHVENNSKETSTQKYTKSLVYALIAIILITVLIFQKDINKAIEGNESENIVLKEKKDSIKNNLSKINEPSKKVTEEVNQSTLLLSQENRKSKEQTTQQESAQQKEALSQDFVESKITEGGHKDNLEEVKKEITKKDNKDSLLVVKKQNVQNTKENITPTETKPKPKIVLDKQIKLQLTSDEIALSQYADTQYTLQWVALSSLEAANQYREKHPLKGNMLIFRRKKAKGYLYLIVSGQFNNRDDAEHTRIIYLKRAYPGKAWIKSAKSVKKEISALQ
ncbi:AAA family ATPase [Aliikangiella sp. IMCC44359]|uniref:AAA family ATPase n=1 Tax=Aliikangiella sp. IMCC44359 TaxID=3459125 RepID=UPI00403A9062